ncbi:TetR/AcrR family transcriptional regulator [Rhizobium halophytocola]|uniref:AcrR family transcriptional regulator n=1 Tax=Rhizobium halophytocola TaxID=735519 RepID=A0ABS4DZS4_9HYPH|nr:TetR/AcrR family transcriptional regulator [Rhizobium halophytocola]MBP1851187.1 AcrR family transcriptional regulator [Rhizobium halophytocola]
MQVPRARGRPKVRSDADSRAVIVDCAFALFLEQGYSATSTGEIAARCHISKRTFYRLFARKIDLFAATVAIHRDLMMHFPPHDPAVAMEEQIATVFRVDIGEEDDRRRQAFMAMSIDESRNCPELLDHIAREGSERSRADLAAWLADGQRLGLIAAGDPLSMARIMMDVLFGAAALKTGHGHQWPGGESRGVFMRHCIQLIVRGIAARPDARAARDPANGRVAAAPLKVEADGSGRKGAMTCGQHEIPAGRKPSGR